jgi:hypothetical protein
MLMMDGKLDCFSKGYAARLIVNTPRVSISITANSSRDGMARAQHAQYGKEVITALP